MPLLGPALVEQHLWCIGPEHWAPGTGILTGMLLDEQQGQPESHGSRSHDGDAPPHRVAGNSRRRQSQLLHALLRLLLKLLQLRCSRRCCCLGGLCCLLCLLRSLSQGGLVSHSTSGFPQERLHITPRSALVFSSWPSASAVEVLLRSGHARSSKGFGHSLCSCSLQTFQGPGQEGFEILSTATLLPCLLCLLLSCLFRCFCLLFSPFS
mmetsp:Transcript_30202/g.64340  ORF Transcript_30202/g.64340 Transcript_30202/m.64340 type:complete len:209 (-) Transcript_30202:231-857(-)